MTDNKDVLLKVTDLRVRVPGSDRPAVDGVSFDIRPGETVALVGESGSGKSLTAKAVAGLLPDGLAASGSIRWLGNELVGLKERERRLLRGRDISMLLQDPFTMLNPLITVGRTLDESAPQRNQDGRRPSARSRREGVQSRLVEVGIPPGQWRTYPWEMSGGMRQRVGTAAAIAKHPRLLIADEPTTALDATTQREVLRLIRGLQHELDMALLLITHDLRVAMSMSDRVLIMHDGTFVEESDPVALRGEPKETYTRRLLAAELPLDHRLDDVRVDVRMGATAGDVAPPPQHPQVMPAEPASARPLLLSVTDLQKRFASGDEAGNGTWALRGVNLELRQGQSLGVIGESGSGKSTLARCILGLETPTSGSIRYVDEPVQPRSRRPANRFHPRFQCVFQDPYSSLNPVRTIGFALRESLRHRPTAGTAGDGVMGPESEIAAMLLSVGLDPDVVDRLPSSLSGGQRQRVAIARALLMKPQVLICDEPVAALDLSVQSQVLHVLRQAQQSGVALLFITHDVSVARQMTDDLIVMHRGEVVERGSTADVIGRPDHDYTKKLLAAVPRPEAEWLSPTLAGLA